MAVLPPERLNHLLGRFRNVLSKPQFENFRSVMFGLIMSGCKERDVKSMRDTVGETVSEQHKQILYFTFLEPR
ncbi:MAG: hypothetical protein WAM14_05780, partial [Candidatus Nitrosopolaris sp.]